MLTIKPGFDSSEYGLEYFQFMGYNGTERSRSMLFLCVFDIWMLLPISQLYCESISKRLWRADDVLLKPTRIL